MYMYAYEQETMVIFNGDAKSEGGGVVDKVIVGMVKRSFCCLKNKKEFDTIQQNINDKQCWWKQKYKNHFQ